MLEAPDYTDRYNTRLSPAEEAQFQQWARAQNRQHDTFDYDLRGAWKNNSKEAVNGHLPDTYKKPNHPTFSSESVYNGADGIHGGQWVEARGKWQFKASPDNLVSYGPDELQNYFRQNEPDAALVLPSRMNQMRALGNFLDGRVHKR